MHKTKPIIITNSNTDDWIAYHYWYTREDWKKATKKLESI